MKTPDCWLGAENIHPEKAFPKEQYRLTSLLYCDEAEVKVKTIWTPGHVDAKETHRADLIQIRREGRV